ncbi:hypothetical protein [Terrabacter sp. NPDC080008]|uniref:hypothetical protein n=1 Tax=Terrabacter sp. NPDC080008 TaxID=3155176 RepID=UPI00344EC6C6
MTGRRGPAGPERHGHPGGGRGGGAAPSGPDGLERLRRAALSAQRAPVTVVARGTLRRGDTGAQPLFLDADDGTTWELLLPPGWSVDAEPGARVTVSGDPADEAGTGSAMSAVLRVRSLSRGD